MQVMEKMRVSQMEVWDEMSTPWIYKENNSASVLSFYIFIFSFFARGRFYQQTFQ